MTISSVSGSHEDTIVKMKANHIIFKQANIEVVLQEENYVWRPDFSLDFHAEVENWI
jgi:hypothetical protein